MKLLNLAFQKFCERKSRIDAVITIVFKLLKPLCTPIQVIILNINFLEQFIISVHLNKRILKINLQTYMFHLNSGLIRLDARCYFHLACLFQIETVIYNRNSSCTANSVTLT